MSGQGSGKEAPISQAERAIIDYLIPLDDVTEALLNVERGLRTDRAGDEQE